MRYYMEVMRTMDMSHLRPEEKTTYRAREAGKMWRMMSAEEKAVRLFH